MPLGLSGFIFHTEIIGECFLGLEKDKECRSQEILLYVYVGVLYTWPFCLVLPKLFMLIKLWSLWKMLLY